MKEEEEEFHGEEGAAAARPPPHSRKRRRYAYVYEITILSIFLLLHFSLFFWKSRIIFCFLPPLADLYSRSTS
jgi:hypothetical protein